MSERQLLAQNKGHAGAERWGPSWSECMPGAQQEPSGGDSRAYPGLTHPQLSCARTFQLPVSTLPVPCVGHAFPDPLSRLPAQVSTSVLASPAPQCVLFFLQSLTVCLSLVDPSAAPPLYLHTLVRTSPSRSQHALHLSCSPCLPALRAGTLSHPNVNAPGAPH